MNKLVSKSTPGDAMAMDGCPSQPPQIAVDLPHADSEPMESMQTFPLEDILPSTPVDTPKTRRILPDSTALNLYKRWEEVLPTLVDPLLRYISSSTGVISQPVSALQSTCVEQLCERRTSTVLCLFHDCE